MGSVVPSVPMTPTHVVPVPILDSDSDSSTVFSFVSFSSSAVFSSAAAFSSTEPRVAGQIVAAAFTRIASGAGLSATCLTDSPLH